MIEIARISTIGTRNRGEIVRRLMDCCASFKGLIYADAVAQFRYFEKAGQVVFGNGYLVIYHDCN